MFLQEFLFALTVALLITSLMISVFRWQHPGRVGAGASRVFLFVIFLFLVWVGGSWLTPFGPTLWGATWLPFVFIGVIVMLLLLAVSPGPPDLTDAVDQVEIESAHAAAAIFGVIFWVFILLMVLALLTRYLFVVVE